MDILFYATREFTLPRVLFESIRQAGLSGVSLECLRSAENLRRRLMEVDGEPPLIITCPADRQELKELVGMQEIFLDRDLILILPDETEETIALAHRLRPRFLCYIDDYADRVGEVAWNILRRRGQAMLS